MKTKGTLRTCKAGHQYYKSSDCPVCPVCEQAKKPEEDFLRLLSAPARRALENAGIRTLTHLSQWREDEVLELHGAGPASIPRLRKALAEAGLRFKI